jgi:hypothetical protein
VAQAQVDPDGGVIARGCFDLRYAVPGLIDAVDVQSGLGEVADVPTGHRRRQNHQTSHPLPQATPRPPPLVLQTTSPNPNQAINTPTP